MKTHLECGAGVLVVTGQAVKTIPALRRSLTGALLAIFLRKCEPAADDRERLGFDFEKGEAAA